MATPIELQRAEAAWKTLNNRMTALWLEHGAELKIAIVNILNRTAPPNNLLGAGPSWNELVQGKITLTSYLRGLEAVASALNEIEARESLALTTLKRFYVEVVEQTTSDVATSVANAANAVKDGAFPVWLGVVVVLVLVLAIKVA